MASSRRNSKKAVADIDQYLYQFRLILVGDSHVGKSCLLRRFKEGRFIEFNDPTVGVDFHTNMIQVDGSNWLKLQLWDTAGHERFRAITRSYYRNAVGVLLVFDVTDRNSFNKIPEWIEDILQSSKPNTPLFVLVGNKSDLDDKRQVLVWEAQQYASAHKMEYIETSARTGNNTDKVFSLLAKRIYESIESGEIQVGNGWEGVKEGSIIQDKQLQGSRVSLNQSTSSTKNSSQEKGGCGC